MCIFENLYKTIENQETIEEIHNLWYSNGYFEHYKSIEHIEAFVWFIAELLIFLIPTTLIIISIYLCYKLGKSIYKDINKSKCKNAYTDCNTCNKCEYKEDCKNGF